MEMKLNIELPFFPGFYESALENSDTFYIEAKEDFDYIKEKGDIPSDKEFNYDDYFVNSSDYEQDCVNSYIGSFKEYKPKFVKEMEYSYIDSPKYYNYSTDKVYVNIVIDRDEYLSSVQAFLKENEEWLKKSIKEDWSSRDGFISYMSDEYDEWLVELRKKEIDDRYMSCIIAYMMYRENENVYNDLIEDVLNNISAWSYISYKPNIEEDEEEK